MKYGELNLGQVEAVVNKLGGMEGVRRFLAGNSEVVATTKKLLQPVTTASVPATEGFKSVDNFLIDTSASAPVRICYLGDNFKKHFGRKVEGACEAADIRIHQLAESSLDAPILAELGDKAEITLGQFFSLLSKQGKGETGPLLTNGWANIAYIRDDEGALWTVSAHWHADDGGWDVNAYSVEHPCRWSADRQVVSR